MSGPNKLLLSMMLLFALLQLVKADHGEMRTFENVDFVRQAITLFENGTADVYFNLIIKNDTMNLPTGARTLRFKPRGI